MNFSIYSSENFINKLGEDGKNNLLILYNSVPKSIWCMEKIVKLDNSFDKYFIDTFITINQSELNQLYNEYNNLIGNLAKIPVLKEFEIVELKISLKYSPTSIYGIMRDGIALTNLKAKILRMDIIGLK